MSDSQSTSPSFLDHARFHSSSAAPVGASNPLEYFDQAYASENNTLPNDKHPTGIKEQLLCLEKDLYKEKLNLSMEDVLLLSAVAHDARREHVDINWDKFFPSLLPTDELRAMGPVCMTHKEHRMSSSGHPVLNRYGMESSVLQENLPSVPKDLSCHVESVIGELKNEKLSCSKESLVLIKNARKCDSYPDDVSTWFDAILRPCQETHELSNFLSPMSSSQLYSTSPSPKSRILPDPQSMKKKRSNPRKYPRKPRTASQKVESDSNASSPFTALGSLAAFMETRGKVCGRRINAKSPYFVNKD